jgi:hypothetical protein
MSQLMKRANMKGARGMSIEPDWEKRLKEKQFRKPMFTADMWQR